MGQTDTQRIWLISRPTTLLCHLRDCGLHPDDVRSRAQQDYHESYSPQKGTRQQTIIYPHGAGSATIPAMIPPAPVGTGIVMPLQSHGGLLQPLNITPAVTASVSPLFPASSTPLPSTAAQISTSNLLGLSSYNSMPPSPALSSISVTSYHPKRQRLTQSGLYRSGSGSLGPSASASASPLIHWSPEIAWTSADQTDWETGLARLTASAGLPLRWIENPEWKKFCDRFLPTAKNPSSKVLTT